MRIIVGCQASTNTPHNDAQDKVCCDGASLKGWHNDICWHSLSDCVTSVTRPADQTADRRHSPTSSEVLTESLLIILNTCYHSLSHCTGTEIEWSALPSLVREHFWRERRIDTPSVRVMSPSTPVTALWSVTFHTELEVTTDTMVTPLNIQLRVTDLSWWLTE